LLCLAAAVTAADARRHEAARSHTLDDYIREAQERGRAAAPMNEGSLYVTSGALANLSRDPRAVQVDDIVTIVVADRASALSKGTVETARSSSANYGISAAGGPTRAGGSLADLARASGQQQLKGEGATSRENTLNTTLSARITHVLPNGLMVIEGDKSVAVNSETQVVRVRGLIRREDINSANAIRSDRIAELEIAVNGRGVVADSIRRPFILYRILLGLLPF
jgi:flagellar L-ring protein precursor FlgH